MKQKSNYKILNLIGRGQFGRVFVAVERKTGRLVALKELNPKRLSTNDFLRELNFLVTLNHENIVSCQALEHYQNSRYLVMDYCEGGTLRNLLNSSLRLTLNQSLELIIDILRGLQFAHDRGIIHRDIKPENILLKIKDLTWTAHISDFGIAKLYREINPQVNMGDTGSPAYMSPEQFYGQYSYSCDLYAVGIVLYELVVGERPFSGMPKELMSAHLNQPVTIPQTVPFMVRSAIAKALEKLPHRRFKDASAMAKALQLAKDILPNDYCHIAPQPRQPAVLKLLATELLPKSVNQIAIAAQKIYLGTGNRLYLNLYSDSDLSGDVVQQWNIPLDNQIQHLQIQPPGCLIATQASIYFLPLDTTTEKFRFFTKTFLPILSFPTNSLVSSIEPQGHWLSVSYLPHRSRTPSWEIWQLPNCQLKRSQINRKPWHHLIALNRRYGLGIYINREQNTEFHLFNRRGNWLANFTVELQLDRVVYNPLFPVRLLATEVNNPDLVISITLRGFTVERIDSEITPALITSCPQGYLISDRGKNITLIDGRDLSIDRFQISLESTVTSIASTSAQLLVATTSSQQSQLHRFALSRR